MVDREHHVEHFEGQLSRDFRRESQQVPRLNLPQKAYRYCRTGQPDAARLQRHSPGLYPQSGFGWQSSGALTVRAHFPIGRLQVSDRRVGSQ
jgi:hypothetical protein